MHVADFSLKLADICAMACNGTLSAFPRLQQPKASAQRPFVTTAALAGAMKGSGLLPETVSWMHVKKPFMLLALMDFSAQGM